MQTYQFGSPFQFGSYLCSLCAIKPERLGVYVLTLPEGPEFTACSLEMWTSLVGRQLNRKCLICRHYEEHVGYFFVVLSSVETCDERGGSERD